MERTRFCYESKILPDTDLKIILSDHQNNVVGILKIISNAAKNFDILATRLSVLNNYFDYFNEIPFFICNLLKFRSFSKIVLSV